MTDVDPLLAKAFDDLGRQAPHDPDLAGSVRRRARRQAAVAGSVLAVLAVAGVSTVVAVGRPDGGAVAPGRGRPTTAPPALGRLPGPGDRRAAEWAWTGFSDPQAGGIPFVRSAKGDLVAILFGPLTAPAVPDRSNKILWVPNPSPSGPTTPPPDVPPAVIEARLEGTDRRVSKELLALGPSIVDLPQPGCWHFDVSWGQYTDSLSLRYVPG